MKHLILTPAYGRDYKNKKDIADDFNKGKDFIIANVVGEYGQWNGKYINKPQIQGPHNIEFRYRNNRASHTIVYKG